MSDLGQIRLAMADALSGIPNVNVSAYMQANPTLPVIWVKPSSEPGIQYHRAMQDGVEFWTLTVQAFVGTLLDRTAQENLDRLIDRAAPHSVKAALELDKTLGGLVSILVVQSCTGYQEYARADGTTALGAEWTVLAYL